MPIAGKTPNDVGGVLAAEIPTLEAYWLHTAYVTTEDKRGGNTWMMDLLHDCPLYKAIETA